ncbi:hypothetical protein BD769DRAFT_1390759 [Suillus cothurnatus]|nr:hypothetical protein BD769DRAFT_1390759 [Suillus cothurnatus]
MVPLYLCTRCESIWNTCEQILVHFHIPVHPDTSASIFFQNGLRAKPDEGAMGCSNKRLCVRVYGQLRYRECSPFEEKCKGRLSLLASQVLADLKGIVWMYEPTPSEDTVSIRAHRLCIVRQYDAAVERILEAMLGCISKLLDSSVVGESVSHYYPEYSGIDPGLPSVPQEAHSEEASIKENVREAEGDNTSAALTSHLDRWRRVPNHKDLYIDAQPLDAFQPGMRNALEKLQWASTHATTVPEDIMDSLSCIFGV